MPFKKCAQCGKLIDLTDDKQASEACVTSGYWYCSLWCEHKHEDARESSEVIR